jgi:hypothetical protein
MKEKAEDDINKYDPDAMKRLRGPAIQVRKTY